MNSKTLSASRASERFFKLVRQSSNLSRNSTGSIRSLRRNLSKSASLGNTDKEVVMKYNNNNLRIIFLGKSYVGKTSIINQFLGRTLPTKYKPTLQQMFVGKLVLGVSTFFLNIEDTGGSYIQDFPAMAKLSLDKSDVAVLVFSVDEPETFEEVSRLKDIVRSYRPSLPIVIVANKIDKEWELPAIEIETTVCLDWECGYVECSTRHQDEKIFKELIVQAKIVQEND